MVTSARLDVTDLEVVPGAPAQCRVTVANHGTVVEEYSLRVVGELEAWSRVEPAVLRLDTEGQDVAVVTVDVPRGPQVRAGHVPFAVVVQPREHPDDVAVPEATAHVAPFDAVTAELTPRTSHGRRVARHQLALDNRGNRPLAMLLTGWDPDDALNLRLRPDELTVRPGEAAFVTVAAVAADRIWRGPPVTRQFRVTADSAADDDTDSVAERPPLATVDGVMVQDATLPPWLGRALLAAAAVLVGLAVLWFAALKPVIETTAREAAEEAVEEQIGAVQEEVAAVQQQAAEAQAAASAAEQTAETIAAGAAATSEEEQAAQAEVLAAQQQALAGAPFSERLAVSAGPGGSDTASFLVPDGQILRVTDLVFESPGDVGRLQVLRDDQVLLSLRPENFRDLDQHFVSPIIFTEGQQLVVQVDCTTPAPGTSECQEAVYVGGSLAAVPEPAAETG